MYKTPYVMDKIANQIKMLKRNLHCIGIISIKLIIFAENNKSSYLCISFEYNLQ